MRTVVQTVLTLFRLSTRTNQSRLQSGTIHLQVSTTKTCTLTVIGNQPTRCGPLKNATCSCMEQTLTQKWSKAIQEHFTRALKFSMCLLVLNLGTLCKPMNNKTTADKFYAGVDTLQNLTPLVAVQSSTTTTSSTSIQLLDRNSSTFLTGMQDSEL